MLVAEYVIPAVENMRQIKIKVLKVDADGRLVLGFNHDLELSPVRPLSTISLTELSSIFR